MALKHAQLYYVLNDENYSVPYEIESLIGDPEKLDKRELISEIEYSWIEYKKYLDGR